MPNKIGLWIYQPYKYLILLPLFAADTLVFTALASICSLFSPKPAGTMASCWAKVMQWITPMPVHVVGRENVTEGQSYVIVANHQSAYDIILIYGSMPISFRWIMKQELRKTPLLGYACKKCGHIFIDRSSARASWRSIEKAKEVLVGGTSVVIFPEGHRTPDKEMRPFKHGAFKMAFELGLPILPVSIKDTGRVMADGLSTLRPGRVQLTLHKPIAVEHYLERRSELIELLRDTIAQAL